MVASNKKEIAIALGISKKSVGHIIGVLGFWKVCARWVPHMLSDKMKAERVCISRELLECFEKGEDFLGPEQKAVHRIPP